MAYQTIYQKLRCPVCKDDTTWRRYPHQAVEFRCSDCRATYFFAPHSTKPVSVLTDKQRDNRCDCGGCKSRDGR